MHFPQSLARLLDAPEGDQRLAAAFFGGHARGDILLNFLFQMEAEFVICVIVAASSPCKNFA
jgi:hypothetical protein